MEYLQIRFAGNIFVVEVGDEEQSVRDLLAQIGIETENGEYIVRSDLDHDTILLDGDDPFFNVDLDVVSNAIGTGTAITIDYVVAADGFEPQFHQIGGFDVPALIEAITDAVMFRINEQSRSQQHHVGNDIMSHIDSSKAVVKETFIFGTPLSQLSKTELFQAARRVAAEKAEAVKANESLDSNFGKKRIAEFDAQLVEIKALLDADDETAATAE